MSHEFVAQHPDELVRSRGGRIASLGELGQNVTMMTVCSAADAMANAVRGFGAKAAGLGGVPGYAERYWASARR